MSEHQIYEFISLDRPLTSKQMAELRAISTRAEISPTRFWNEYHWGDLKADPAKLVERYFDAHLYVANWGTHRLMLRVPKTRVAAKELEAYFASRHAGCLAVRGEHVILDMHSDSEEPEDDDLDDGSLAVLASLRGELVRGDLRGAYLAWLLAVQAEDLGDELVEPPVPAGLGALTAAQRAMVEFLRIDEDLLAAAAQGCAGPPEGRGEFRRWVSRLSAAEREQWLLRAAEEVELALGADLLRAFRGQRTPGKRRTVGELRALAELQRTKREQVEAARAERASAAAERARQRRLDALARDTDAAWSKLEKLVGTSQYDDAVDLAIDLRDLAARNGEARAFATRFEAMRKRHNKRRGFFDRWKWQQ